MTNHRISQNEQTTDSYKFLDAEDQEESKSEIHSTIFLPLKINLKAFKNFIMTKGINYSLEQVIILTKLN